MASVDVSPLNFISPSSTSCQGSAWQLCFSSRVLEDGGGGDTKHQSLALARKEEEQEWRFEQPVCPGLSQWSRPTAGT